MSEARCHICHREDTGLIAVKLLSRGDWEFAHVHEACFENYERKMLREAWLRDESIQREYTFKEWLKANGAA